MSDIGTGRYDVFRLYSRQLFCGLQKVCGDHSGYECKEGYRGRFSVSLIFCHE